MGRRSLAEPTAAETALASPLTLLREEEQHGDRQAEEALFLSYTTDLGFFEKFPLGVAQACGARVTVIGDVDVSAPDPRATRRAGLGYLPGRACCTGAFHPKLVAIVGSERATVAIGSGNATLAGWQANAELWTVLRGDAHSCPAVFTDLAGWLRNLPERVRFSARVPEALSRVADGLDTLAGSAAEHPDPRMRLVSTSAGPILEQLPSGPVDELGVCAPFHDPGAVALRALVERLRPRRLLVSYQPELTELDGPALAALTGELDVELRADAETHYRHGKLVEWTLDGQRFALTGSPNLSGAALLRGLDHGGNCEVGFVAPVETSLLPDGAATPPATVHTVQLTARTRATSTPLLLGAVRVGQSLHVSFTRTLPAGAWLQLSPAAEAPEVWRDIAEPIPGGSAETTVDIAPEGGSRVRLAIPADTSGPQHSNVVFVVDPVHVERRHGFSTKRAPSTQPEELFDDPQLAERFYADLVELRATLPAPPPRVSAMRSDTQAGVSVSADSLGWERYLDECAGKVGPRLVGFALGLPTPLGGHAEGDYGTLLSASWDEQLVDDAEAGLENDDTQELAEGIEDDAGEAASAVPAPPDLSRTSEEVRKRYQRWARKLAEAAPGLDVVGRLLITRLLLWTAATNVWARDDTSWFFLLTKSLHALAEGESPAKVEPQAASLTAVTLAVLRPYAPRHTDTEETLAYDRAAAATAYLLPATDAEHVDEFRRHLDKAFDLTLNVEGIQDLADEVVQDDPITKAVRALEELDRDAHRHGNRLLHVTGRFGTPWLVALEAVGQAENVQPVGAWATSTNGTWTLCAWRRPDLIFVSSRQGKPLWWHYRLTGPFGTPRILARQKSLEGVQQVQHGRPLTEPFSKAHEILDQLGLALPDPPSSCPS